MSKNPKLGLFYMLLFFIPLVLLGLSLSIHPYENALAYRVIRALISFTFIGASFYLYAKNLDKLVYWHMFFYGLASVFAIFFETNAIGVITMLLNFISFTFLIRMLWQKIDFKSINLMFLMALIIGILINIWLVYSLMVMLYEVFSSTPLLIAICVSIVGSFTVSVLALVYNYNLKSKSSILFFSFIIMLVFAETFRGAAHYELIDNVVGQYWARSLLLIAYMLLFSFSYNQVYKKDKDLLS